MNNASIEALLRDGVAAAKMARQTSGYGDNAAIQRKRARTLLVRVLKMDENNIQAWLWLSTVVDTLADQKKCLHKVLELDPNNKRAMAGLNQLSQSDTPPQQPDIKQQTISRIQPISKKTSSAITPARVPNCPFCKKPISNIDTSCPHCTFPLVMNCPACGEGVDVEQPTCPHCKQAMGNYRKQAYYFAGLGNLYLKNSRFQDAVKAWQVIETINPQFPKLYVKLGQAHLGMGRPDRATDNFEKALKLTPNSADVHFSLGELMRQRAELEDAFDYYQSVLRINPKHGMAWFRKAQIFEQVGAKAEATKAYQKAKKLLPPDSEASLEAQNSLEQFKPTLPETMATSWVELTRQITGPILICVLAVLFDSGLRPWWIRLTGWLALLLAFLGAFLYVSGSSLPRNPLIQKMVGQRGLVAQEKIIAATTGAFLWLMGFGLILLPINQTLPEIPDFGN